MVVYSLDETSRLVIGGRFTVEVVEIGSDTVTLSITDLDRDHSDNPDDANPRVVQLARQSDLGNSDLDSDVVQVNEFACMAVTAN